MKVCYIFRDPNLSGNSIEGIFHNISNYLNNIPEVDIILFFYNNNISLINNLIKLYKIKADIFHITGDVHFISPFLIGKKVINTFHDIGTYKNLKGIKRWIYGMFWVKVPYIFSDKITAVSDYTKNDLNKFFFIKKVEVIYNPVNPNFIYSPPKKKIDKFKILQIGCQPHKNLEGVVSSIKGLNCILIIVGKLSAFQAKLLESNNINFKNYFGISYNKIIKCYKDCDILTFISFHEGFGMPIIEANAIGRPIITSNICSLPEIAGNAAVYVDPKNRKEIRNALETLIKDKKKRNSLVNKGLVNIKRFTLKKIARDYLNVYRSIL